MDITIAERFRPFSTLPRTACVLPFSRLRFEIYPAYLKVYDLHSNGEGRPFCEFALNLQGPIEGFTVLQDLEKGCLKVWGESKEGFFRYRLHATQNEIGFVLVPEKTPGNRFFENVPRETLATESPFQVPLVERLSFGVTKKADWTLVNRRLQLDEILPFWFRLGQLLPEVLEHGVGTAILLKDIEQAIANRDSLALGIAFKNTYLAGLAGFNGLLNPTLIDHSFQGFNLPSACFQEDASPLFLLTRGAHYIKQMLIQIGEDPNASESRVDILPCLLPELHAGRYCSISVGNIGTIDLEWSKKQIRRLIFYSNKQQTLRFNFQKAVKNFRFRKADSKVISLKTPGDSIHFDTNSIYWMDRFEN